MIKSLNIDYSGPIDGHDILAVIKELRRQKIKARNSSRDNYKRKKD
jgi:deoxyxylulose-5-phosphate synthase